MIPLSEYEEAAIERVEARFVTASGGKAPTQGQKEAIQEIAKAVNELALQIELSVPDGRNKALALTALEDTQMRANKAFFSN